MRTLCHSDIVFYVYVAMGKKGRLSVEESTETF